MRRLASAVLLLLLAANSASAGFFQVKQDKGVWWLVDGAGKPFFSAGINVISSGRDPKDVKAEIPEYCGLCFYKDHDAWWKAISGRMRKWGFNTVGGWSEKKVLAHHEMPYVISLDLGRYVGAPWIDVGSKESLAIIRPLVEPLAGNSSGRQGRFGSSNATG